MRFFIRLVGSCDCCGLGVIGIVLKHEVIL